MPMFSHRAAIATVVVLTLCTLSAYALVRHPTLQRRIPTIALPPATPVTPPAPAPAPVSVWSASKSGNGDVRLTTAMDRGAVLKGSDGRVHVQLTVAGAAKELGTVRRPTDVVVVLDTSGSMSGSKLQAAKGAVHELIGQLSEDDRLALVTYDDSARTVLSLRPVADRHRVRQAVDSLETGGGTNMSSGLDRALNLLRWRQGGSGSARVLLLSDGHANEGDASVAGLSRRAGDVARQDHVVSTIGIGDDFNEHLMTRLADAGSGNFYYLSSLEKLAAFFEGELKWASSAIAQAVQIHFSAAPGVGLVELAGYPLQRQGKVTVAQIGSLGAGQERKLWATLSAPTDQVRDLDLGNFSIHYKQGEGLLSVNGASLKVACVDDRERFEQGIVQSLWEEVVAKEYFNRGRADLGKAVLSGDPAAARAVEEAFEEHRALAEALGSERALKSLDAMQAEAEQTVQLQSAPQSVRARAAKRQAAQANHERREGAYSVLPY